MVCLPLFNELNMDDMRSSMKALAIALLMESTLTETLENLDATATGEVAHFLFKQRRNAEDLSGIHLAHHKTLGLATACPGALVHAWKAEDTFWEPFSPTLRTVGIKLKSLELTAGTLSLGTIPPAPVTTF